MTRERLHHQRVLDFDYTEDAVAVSALSARRAVLWLLSKEAGTTHPELKASARKVRQLWTERLNDLATTALPRYANRRLRLAMANCLPSTVRTVPGPTKLSCANTAICPWCYSRRVQLLGNRLGLDDGERRLAVLTERRLLTAEHHLLIGARDGLPLRAELQHEAATCRALCRASRLAGVFWHITAEPGMLPAGDPAFVVRTRMLCVLGPGQTLPLRPEGWGVWDVPDTSQERVASSLEYVTTYPVGLLVGDLDVTVQVLAAREGLRLAECCGLLRGGDRDGNTERRTRSVTGTG
jgi:hypothetical protein